MLPNFLIIGAQKSGTTSLYAYLKAHPDVFMASPKEVHYFDRNFDKGIDWYKRLFAGRTTERAVGEASPSYMYVDGGAALMANTLPKARLIAILRNPVDRAYSHYWHQRARNQEPLEFTEAIIAEPERLATGDRLTQLIYSYIDRSRYIYQLQRICQYYPREALLVIIFEEMIRAPIETFRSICRFLEIDDTFIPTNIGKRKHSFRKLRSRNLQRFIRCLPGVLRLRATRLNVQFTSLSANGAIASSRVAEMVRGR